MTEMALVVSILNLILTGVTFGYSFYKRILYTRKCARQKKKRQQAKLLAIAGLTEAARERI